MTTPPDPRPGTQASEEQTPEETKAAEVLAPFFDYLTVVQFIRLGRVTCRRLELVFADGTELCAGMVETETEEQNAERPD